MADAEHEALETGFGEGDADFLRHADQRLLADVAVAEVLGALKLVGLHAQRERKARHGLHALFFEVLRHAAHQHIALEGVAAQRQMLAVVFQRAEGKDDGIAGLELFFQLRCGQLRDVFRPADLVKQFFILIHGWFLLINR